MRQTAQAKTQHDGRDAAKDVATRAGQTIDAWIEAALAEQAKRAQSKTAQEPARSATEGAEQPRVPRDLAAPDMPDLDTRTAALPSGSLASRRSEQPRTDTAPASPRAEGRATDGTISALERKLDTIERKLDTGDRPAVSQALKAIERIESRLGATSVDDGAPAAISESLRGFEARMKDLSDRFAVPRPVGRRGAAPADEIGRAVAEIRSHQAALEAGTAARRPAPSGVTLASVPRPPAAPVRGYGDMLSEMRTDIARIAGQVETARTPVLDGLKNEIDALRNSIADLPKREDLGSIEQSVAVLADEVTSIRREGRAIETSQMDALQAEIRRIGVGQDTVDHAKLSRDIDVLSHKLDIVSASGMDPKLTTAMAAELVEMRAALEGLASAREVALLSQQIAGLKRDIAAIGKGQINAAEFASLKGTVEEMKTTLARPAAGAQKSAGPVQLARGQLEPIESMLETLAGKIDRVERHVADPQALDQLERQLAGLVSVLGSSGGRDPSLASLEDAMAALLREVGSWREGTAEIAEHAARSALAETARLRSPSTEPAGHDDLASHLAGLREDYAAAEKRVGRSLEGVEAMLQGVVQQLSGLDRRDRPGASRREAGVASRPAAADRDGADEAARRMAHAVRPEAASGRGSEGAAEGTGEEILLEPGERPRGRGRKDMPTIDPGDIKSSFIAAARRAAQAAADDAAASKAGSAEPDAGVASRSELVGRLRELFQKQRRPLLIGAAAVALALGGFQLTREKAAERTVLAGHPGVAAQVVAAPARPASGQLERSAIPDPQTTQSLADAAADEAPRSQPEPPATLPPVSVAPAVAQSASAPPAAAPQTAAGAAKPDALDTAKIANLSGQTAAPAAPTTGRPDPAAAITALRQAALGGNALALYDLAARTSEGRGVPRDLQLGTGYFEKAAEKGLAPAQYRTGNAYEKGVGVARDLEVAKTWYKRAAESGNTRAMHNLAVLIAEGAGGKPDYPTASGWFQRAAEQGVRDSQYNLAVLYARGLGTPQDFSKSYLWFAVAAGQGDEDAGRKRDEVGARLSAADLARAKAAVERWRATPANVSANEVAAPTLPALPLANTTADAPAKRQQREGRG